MAKIKDVFTLQMGKTPARAKSEYYENGTNKWVSISDLSTYGKYVDDTKEHLSNVAVTESGIKPVPANTVIMSFKLSIGKTAITRESIYTNEAIMAFIPNNPETIIPDYLYYSFSGRDWENGTNRAVMGATLNKATIGELQIDIPDLNKQRAVVERMDKVSALIDLRKRQLAKLDELVKSRFVEMFGDPVSPSSKFDRQTFGNAFKVTSGGTPATDKSEYWENGTISWIGSNMCQDKIIYYNDGKFITEAGLNHSSAKIFESGTVLVALVGATIGKTALLRFSTATNQNVAAIDVNGNKAYNAEFVFYHLQFLYSKFQEIGSGKFKMANQSFIKNLPLICVPIELQKQFAAFVEQIDMQKSTIQQSLGKLETLKKSLMQEYFG